MRRGILIGVSLLLTGAVIGSGVVQGAPAQPIELKIMHFLPSTSVIHTGVFVPWAKMLEEKTGGRVKATIYPSELLGKMADTYESVVNGTADIGFSASIYTPGLFPLWDVFSLPFMYPTMRIGTRVMWEQFEKDPDLRAEFRDVKVLFFTSTSMIRLNTTTKPVRTVDDLKGMKIRTGGGPQVDALRALGAIPVVISAPDVYTALERNTADGATFPWEAVKAFRIYDVTKYHNSLTLWGGEEYAVMNLKKWQGLPPDIQKIIESISGAWGSDFASDAWEKEDVDSRDFIKGLKGHEIVDFAPAEVAKLRARVNPIYDQFVTDNTKKGLPAKRVLDETVKLVEQHSKDK
jgi:TRAP-type C4-dicarboxylate transport system substrate-binding protein